MEEEITKRSYNRQQLSKRNSLIHGAFSNMIEPIESLIFAENPNQYRVRTEEVEKTFNRFPGATFPVLEAPAIFEVQFAHTKFCCVNLGKYENIIKIVTFTVYQTGEVRYTITCPTLAHWKDFNNTRLYSYEEWRKGLWRFRNQLIKDEVDFVQRMPKDTDLSSVFD